MNDIAVFLQMLLVLAAMVAPFVVLARLLAGREDFGFDEIVRPNWDLPWPKGVQEPDPLPWKVGFAVG